ncbi:MAG: sigma factor-like helix-turn-helix DNA-binding protein [Candidatus Methanospirareceae archaeon]
MMSFRVFYAVPRSLNALLSLITTIHSTWTDRQREVVTFCRFHNDYTYSAIARELNVSKQLISQVVRAAHWPAIQQGEQAVRRLLQELPALREDKAVKNKAKTLDNKK